MTEWRGWPISLAGSGCMVSPSSRRPPKFLERYDPGATYLQRLLARFCSYRGIDSRTVRLKIYSDSTPGADVSTGLNTHRRTATGVFEREVERFNVLLNQATLVDPPSVAATMTHELAHVLLLGENRTNVKYSRFRICQFGLRGEIR